MLWIIHKMGRRLLLNNLLFLSNVVELNIIFLIDDRTKLPKQRPHIKNNQIRAVVIWYFMDQISVCWVYHIWVQHLNNLILLINK